MATPTDAVRGALTELGMNVIGRMQPVGEGFGLASSRLRTRVADSSGREYDVVVKVWDHREHGLDEVRFYREWAPTLPVRLPAFNGSVTTDEVAYLVLEDLRPIRQGDAASALSANDARLLARALGRIHAATMNRQPGFAARGVPRSPDWHTSRRQEYLERFGASADPTLRWIVSRSDHAERIAAELLQSAPTGLLHGDVHADNVVFLASGQPVFLDWARPGWGAGALDLAALLVSGVEPEEFGGAVDAYRSNAPLSDDALAGAVLLTLVTNSLGIARWQPTRAREQRILRRTGRLATSAARWLARWRPEIMAGPDSAS